MIEDNQKRPWGIKGLSCQHAPYLNLAIAVVEMAQQDIAAGARVFRNFGAASTGEVMQRAAISWRWMSDPTVCCARLSFAEICDGTGTDMDLALDSVDEIGRGFPPGYRRHLEHVIRLVDARAGQPKKWSRKRKEATCWF